MDNIWGGLSNGGWIINYRALLGWVTSSKTWPGIWKALEKVSHVGSSSILALCPQNNTPHIEQYLGYKHDPSPIFLSFFPQCTTQIYFLPVILLKSLHLFLFSPQYSRFFCLFVCFWQLEHLPALPYWPPNSFNPLIEWCCLSLQGLDTSKFLWIFLFLFDDVIISVTHTQIHTDMHTDICHPWEGEIDLL